MFCGLKCVIVVFPDLIHFFITFGPELCLIKRKCGLSVHPRFLYEGGIKSNATNDVK